MKTTLQEQVEKVVSVESFYNDEPDGTKHGPQFSVSGLLEDHESEDWFVRVKEDGTSGVSFHERQVHGMEILPSGRVMITLAR